MKHTLFSLTISACITAFSVAHADEKTDTSAAEKPMKHLKLPDITNEKQATAVMKSTTKKLSLKSKFDAKELHEIHMITYSLEKAIAYFVKNTTGDQLATAKKMAVVVEEVHLNSESNRPEKTKKALNAYFKLESKFSKNMAVSQIK